MKNIFTTLTLLIAINTYSQVGMFSFKPDGNSDFVVNTVEGFKAEDIYKKVINWVSLNYQNPESVIKAKIENEYIRITGFNSESFSRTLKSGSKFQYGIRYSIEIQIKDGKFRFKYTPNEITTDEGKKVYFTLFDVLSNKPDNNGNAWDGSKEELENNIQSLNNSIYSYITKPKENW